MIIHESLSILGCGGMKELLTMIDRCFRGKYTTVLPLRGELVTSKADKNIERFASDSEEGEGPLKKDKGRDLCVPQKKLK